MGHMSGIPKLLVIGCGSIGRRHYRLLKEMGVDAIAYDVDEDALRVLSLEMGAASVCSGDLGSVLRFNKPDGAIVATPNHLHTDPAIACIVRGIPILIEKPITHTVSAAQRILWTNAGGECGDGPDVSVLVGYTLRWHEGYRRVKTLIGEGALGTIRHASVWCSSFLPDWRPGMDYRTGYAAKRETGGGVLLDCSHELDLCNWWFGEPKSVMAMVRNTGALDGLETEDVADVLIDYGNVQASVHLDYLNHEYRRGCVIIGDKATLQFDFTSDAYHLQIGDRLQREYWPVERDAMYRAELQHFLAVIKGETAPLVTVDDGIRALQLVEAAKGSALEGRVVAL